MKDEKSVKLRHNEGILDLRVYYGEPNKPVLLLFHGATNDMNHPLISGLATSMKARGWSSVRFNFGFVSGKKKPNFAEVAREYITVLTWIKSEFKGLPVYIAGKSLGGFVCIFNAKRVKVDGIIVFGYPLIKPDGALIEQSHLSDLDAPILFIKGIEDPYTNEGVLNKVIREYSLNALSFWLNGVGHSMEGAELIAIEIAEESLVNWYENESN